MKEYRKWKTGIVRIEKGKLKGLKMYAAKTNQPMSVIVTDLVHKLITQAGGK